MRLAVLLTILLLLLSAGNLWALTTHSVHIEWDYDISSVPIGTELSAYRLYKDGTQVCQIDYPYDFAGDCEFQSENGLYYFTLTAAFDDGSESPHSGSFPFQLGPKKGNTGVILAVLGLLLK